MPLMFVRCSDVRSGIFCLASLIKSNYHTLAWAFRCAFYNPTSGNAIQLICKWGSFFFFITTLIPGLVGLKANDTDNREDVGRRAGHADLRKFTAVLASCKKLPPSPRLGKEGPCPILLHFLIKQLISFIKVTLRIVHTFAIGDRCKDYVIFLNGNIAGLEYQLDCNPRCRWISGRRKRNP